MNRRCPLTLSLVTSIHLYLARYWHVLNINVTVQSNTDARYLQKLTVFRKLRYWGSCKTKKKAGTWPGGVLICYISENNETTVNLFNQIT